MPETSAEVLSELNVQARSFDMMDNFGLYPSGNKVTADPKVVFARQDIAEVLKQAEEIAKKYEKVQEAPAKESKQEPLPEQIGIEDFAKVALRVALVTACEKVEKSDKLLKLTLSLGNEQRTVASGIAEYYKPEEVVGKKVILVANLKPAKLRGILSEGMILCAEKDGKVTLVEPNADMPEGSVVR